MTSEATRDKSGSAADLAWACRVLGAPTGATREQIRAAALAELEKASFLPPPRLEQAVLLTAEQLPCELWARDSGDEMYRGRERKLRKDIERLAEEFFSYEPAKRRAVWQSLKEKAAFSISLSARLDALAAGLDVTVPSFGDDAASASVRLAKGICQSFVMLPSARAAWLEEHLNRALVSPRVWQAATRDLHRRFPQVVPLAPEFVLSLSQSVRRRKVAAKEAKQNKRHKAEIRKANTSSSRSSGWATLLVIAMFCALRVAFNSHSTSASKTMPVTPVVIPTRTPSSDPYKGTAARELIMGMQEASRRSVLPPPGPAYLGRKIELGEAFRRLCDVPNDVDVYLEDGKYVLRRRATARAFDPPEGVRPTGVPKRTWTP